MNNLRIPYDRWSEIILNISIQKLSGQLPVNLKIVPAGETRYPWELYLPLKEAGRADLLNLWQPSDAIITTSKNEFGCTAGKDNFAIDGYGNVYGCSLMVSIDSLRAGNINNESIIDIWNNSDLFTKFRKMKLENVEGGCSSCEELAYCKAGCRACAYSATQKINGSDLRCPKIRYNK